MKERENRRGRLLKLHPGSYKGAGSSPGQGTHFKELGKLPDFDSYQETVGFLLRSSTLAGMRRIVRVWAIIGRSCGMILRKRYA